MARKTNGATRESPRGNRIASKVQTIVAEILRDKFSDDPIISGVSLVGADAHGGLSFVRLYYYTNIPSTSGANATVPFFTKEGVDAPADGVIVNNITLAQVQERLDAVTKMIRYELAARLDQKYTPEIKFTYDDTIDRANRIEELLKNL